MKTQYVRLKHFSKSVPLLSSLRGTFSIPIIQAMSHIAMQSIHCDCSLMISAIGTKLGKLRSKDDLWYDIREEENGMSE